MMSPGHAQQMEILVGAIVLIFAVIVGALIMGMMKNAKKREQLRAQELSHEAKREMPTTSEQPEELPLAHIDSTGNVVSDLSVPDLHDAAVVIEEKAVDLAVALKKTEENLLGRIRSLFKTETSNKHLEEIEEIKNAETDFELAAEIGDLLFALVNVARWKHVDAESALRGTNMKFKKRFAYVEQGAKRQGRQLSELTLEEMDHLWNEAKKKES